MKKNYILLCLLSSVFVNAQIQSEDFENGTIPIGWSSNILTGSADWAFGSGAMPSGDSFATFAAIFDDDAAGDTELDNSANLISPEVNVASYTTLSLSFEYAMQAFIDKGLFTAEVWDGTGWIEILSEDVDTNPNVVTYDVTIYKNAAFKVRFTYDDEDEYAWGAGVDDFVLTGTTLGTQSATFNKFSVYPNPTSDYLKFNGNEMVTDVKISNTLGQIVLNPSVKNNSVDVSNLAQGVYVVNFTVDNTSYSNKFSKK